MASKLKDRVKEAAAAAFSGIWIRSYEHEDAIREIAQACKDQGWHLLLWDPEQGTTQPGAKGEINKVPGGDTPVEALSHLRKMNVGEENRVLLVMRNVHPFLAGLEGRIVMPVLLQAMQQAIEQGAGSGQHVVVLSYESLSVPPELEKMVYVIDHDLPGPEELWEIMTSIEAPDRLPKRDSPEAQLLIDAAAGLSRLEAAGAFSLSIARSQGVRPDALWELKASMLRKSSLLQMYQGTEGFDMLGGLNAVKDFCLRAINSPNKSAKVKARGVIALGPPGVGKSALAKALGYEVGWPTIILDPGGLMGKYVGETELNTRRALKTIDAMAPCILMVDEIEKALEGGGSGGNDSGVGARMLGTLLTWLNDHTSEVFFIGTSNNIEALSKASAGAFTRAERFDGVFFMDLPGPEQLATIWKIYRKYFDVLSTDVQPPSDNWTGAEIRACCRLSRLLNIPLTEAATQVVPVAVTAREQIESLRDWASKRCLAADYRGIYDRATARKMMRPEEITVRPKRRVVRGNNK